MQSVKNCLISMRLYSPAVEIRLNQMNIYHTLLKVHNIIWNSSSEQIKIKWAYKHEPKHFLRSGTRNDQRIPERQ